MEKKQCTKGYRGNTLPPPLCVTWALKYLEFEEMGSFKGAWEDKFLWGTQVSGKTRKVKEHSMTRLWVLKGLLNELKSRMAMGRRMRREKGSQESMEKTAFKGM